MGKWIFLPAFFFAVACCRQVVPSKEIIEQLVIRERIRVDTVEVALPVERVEVVRRDSSFLETSIAVSWARINPDGLLSHALQNKSVKPKITVQVRDSVIYQTRHEKIVEVVEVERKLTWWQRLRLTVGSVTLALLGGMLLYGVGKRILFRA